MEFAGSPKRDKMEEIGEQLLAKHMSGKTQNHTGIFPQTDELFQIVLELSTILKTIGNNPTTQQLEKVEFLANSLTKQLQIMRKVPNPEIGDNSKLFESYKILSCALLLLQKYQNYRSLHNKFEELKKEYELDKKLQQEEIEALKSNESISFRTLASNTQNCAEQISQARKETQLIQSQFNEYKNSANKIFASMKKLLQLPEGTSLKDLSNEIDLKIHAQQNASILDQDYDKLRNEIKSLSTQNLSFQARDKQVSDELRSLRESAIVKENQIATLIQEKELLQNKIKDLVLQQQQQTQQETRSFFSETDRSDIFLLQTDLNTSKMNLENSIKKIERLKAKLKKARDELTITKDENENFKQQLETMQLELHHYQLENDNNNDYSNNSKSSIENASGFDIKSEIQAKDIEIEKLKSALDQIAQKLQTQSSEIIQEQQIKENLINCLQKQTLLISGIIKEANELEKQVQVKEIEKGDALALLEKMQDENSKLKMFVTGIAQIVAANSAPELASSVSTMIESLSIDSFREFFYSHLHEMERSTTTTATAKTNDNNNNDRDENLVERLFGYLEEQIEILQNVANSKSVTDSNKKASILRSCARANKFVNDHYSSMYSNPSIFHSFGLVVDPSELTNSLKSFLQTFDSKNNRNKGSQTLIDDDGNENDNLNLSSNKSRELFVITKEAIAMNALLRNIASLLRKENQKMTIDLKQAKEEVKKVLQVEDETKNRLESIEKRFNDSLDSQKDSMKRTNNIIDSLNLLINNDLIKLPQRLLKAVKNNESFNSVLTNSEIESFLSSKNKKDSANLDNVDELKAKLEKSQKMKKQLKQKVLNLSKQIEEEQKKKSEQIDSYKNEIDSLSKTKESLEEENNKLIKNHETSIAAINDDYSRKMAEAQKNASKEIELTIDRIRSEFQSDLKAIKNELKAKLRKAESVAQSQKERADNLRAHYEALLESARSKLNIARKAEQEAKEDLLRMESENRQLKSKASSMTIDNKMLSIQLSSYEQQNNNNENIVDIRRKGSSSYSSPSSPSNDQVLTRMKQAALITQLEDKVDASERQSREFLLSIKELFRSFTEFGDNFLNFESAKKVLQKAAAEMVKMKEASGKFSEAVDELNKIKSVVSPHPGVSTAFAVSVKIEQMQKEIQKLRKQI